MKKLLFLSFATFIFAACNQTATTPEMQQDTSMMAEETTQETNEAGDTMQNLVDGDQITVLSLTAQSNSGQTGTATISKMSDTQTKVVVELTGGNYTQPQPAHIHTGTCKEPGPVVYPLTNVVNGMSETVLDAAYQDVIDPKDAEYILNVHESAAKSTVYTSCVEWDD